MLRYLHKYGATLTIDLVIETEADVPINILTDPWQTLQIKAAELATQARGREAATHRKCLGGQAEIDTAILYAAYRKHPPRTRPMLSYLATGAAWTAGQLHAAGLHPTPNCPLCGQEEEDITHGLWHCPKVQELG